MTDSITSLDNYRYRKHRRKLTPEEERQAHKYIDRLIADIEAGPGPEPKDKG